ncbi:unnamed protein product [Prorocentrum cordatum]|uniref:Uncharacterized protein n=1 Tax=Prorocentrum cordatum TaxID=2364126 RepID=A0ABN9UHC7_9DINO|nr:unnamed protein product [Polarella glacialis]
MRRCSSSFQTSGPSEATRGWAEDCAMAPMAARAVGVGSRSADRLASTGSLRTPPMTASARAWLPPPEKKFLILLAVGSSTASSGQPTACLIEPRPPAASTVRRLGDVRLVQCHLWGDARQVSARRGQRRRFWAVPRLEELHRPVFRLVLHDDVLQRYLLMHDVL